MQPITSLNYNIVTPNVKDRDLEMETPDYTSQGPLPMMEDKEPAQERGLFNASDFKKMDYNSQFNNYNVNYEENKRYVVPTLWNSNPVFKDPRVYNNEDLNGKAQSWVSKLANGLVKTASGFGVGFYNALLPVQITNFAKEGKVEGIYDNETNSALTDFQDNMENWFPNYYTIEETTSKNPVKGLLPFTTGSANFWGDKVLKNLGFMGGAMASAFLQDAAITYATRGIGTVGATTALTGRVAMMLEDAFKGSTLAAKLLQVPKVGSYVGKNLVNIEQAANTWRALSAGEKVLNMAKAQTMLGVAAVGEASTEGYEGSRRINEKLISDFKATNFRNPTIDEYKRIKDITDEAANIRFGLNVATIWGSDAIQFGTLFTPMKTFTTGLLGETFIKGEAKFGAKEVFNEAGELVARNLTKKEKVFNALTSELVKDNLTEGLQEGLQYSIDEATQDYALKKYNNQIRGGFSDYVESQLYGMKKMVGTKEGWENTLLGFLTGFVTHGVKNTVTSYQEKLKGIAPLAEREQKVRDAFNKATQLFKEDGLFDTSYFTESALRDGVAFDSEVHKAVIQQQLKRAVMNKDVFAFKSLRNELLYNMVRTASSLNKFDSLLEKLDGIRNMNDEDFAKAFGLQKTEENQRLANQYVDQLIEKAKETKEIVDLVDNNVQNPIKLPKPGKAFTEEDVEAIENWQAFEALKDTYGYQLSHIKNINDRIPPVIQDILNANPNITVDLIDKISDFKNINEKYLGPVNDQTEALREQIKNLEEAVRDVSLTPELTRLNRESLQEAKRQLKLNEQLIDRVNPLIEKFQQAVSEEYAEAVPDEARLIYKDIVNAIFTHEINKQKGVTTEYGTGAIEDVISALIDLHRLRNSVGIAIDENGKLQTEKGRLEFLKKYRESKKYAEDAFLQRMQEINYKKLLKNKEEALQATADGITTTLSEMDSLKATITQLDQELNNPETTEERKQEIQNEIVETRKKIEGLAEEVEKLEKIKYSLEQNKQTLQEEPKEDEVDETVDQISEDEEATPQEIGIQKNLQDTSGLSLTVGRGISAVWDRRLNKFRFFNKNGKEFFANPQILKYASRLANVPNTLNTWWSDLLDNKTKNDIRNFYVNFLDFMNNKYNQDKDIVSLDVLLMKELRGVKFKPTDVKRNTTDINESKWLSPDGVSVDQFALERLQSELAENGFIMDEQEIKDAIYDIIQRYPNGITKKDIEKELGDTTSPERQLFLLEQKFANTYGLDMYSVWNKLDNEIRNFIYEEETQDEGSAKVAEDNANITTVGETIVETPTPPNVIVQDTPNPLNEKFESDEAKYSGRLHVLRTYNWTSAPKFGEQRIKNFQKFMAVFSLNTQLSHKQNLQNWLDLNELQFSLIRPTDEMYDDVNFTKSYADQERGMILALTDKNGKPVKVSEKNGVLTIGEGNFIIETLPTADALGSAKTAMPKDILENAIHINEKKQFAEALKQIQTGVPFIKVNITDTSNGKWGFIVGKKEYRLTESDLKSPNSLYVHVAEDVSVKNGFQLVKGSLYFEISKEGDTVIYLPVVTGKFVGNPLMDNMSEVLTYIFNNWNTVSAQPETLRSVEDFLSTILYEKRKDKDSGLIYLPDGSSVFINFNLTSKTPFFTIERTDSAGNKTSLKAGVEPQQTKDVTLNSLNKLLKDVKINTKTTAIDEDVKVAKLEGQKIVISEMPYGKFLATYAKPTVSYELDLTQPIEKTNQAIFFSVDEPVVIQEEEVTPTTAAVDAEFERIKNITDPEERKVAEIKYVMSNLFSGVGEAAANKIKEYADRIINGIDSRENIIKGLPKSFVDGIDKLLAIQQSTPTEVTSDVEAKKADIEKRRQEELNSILKSFDEQIATWKEIKEYTGVNTAGEALESIYDRADREGRVDRERIPGQAIFTFTEQEQRLIDFLNSSSGAASMEDSLDSYIEELENRREKLRISRSDKNKAGKINIEYDAELAALEEVKPTEEAKLENVKPVYHHTTVAPENFNFATFQRGKEQISQFGDGLNASSNTTSFLTKRYGKPIEGEVNDADFVVIDTNKTEKELYDELVAKGYKFNNPATGSYIGGSAATEYDGNEKANEQPAIISLFNDFQKSNPGVKGVKVLNHVIGNEKVAPFYVIYDAKSFYGKGSLTAKIKNEKVAGEEEAKIEAPIIEPSNLNDNTDNTSLENLLGDFAEPLREGFDPNSLEGIDEEPFDIFSGKKVERVLAPDITQTDIEKVQSMIPNANIVQLYNVVNSDAYAKFSEAAITLYRGANRSDLYHEAWHHFSQLYLTKDEKRRLYNETREKQPDATFTTFKGEKKTFKEATDLEIEEYIARDFSKFVETGKIEGKYPERKSIFQKILDFLKRIFTKDSDVSLQTLYDTLYKGKANPKSYSTDNIMFGKLNSGINDNFSPVETKAVMDGMDALFIKVLNFKNVSEAQLNKIKNLDQVYNLVEKVLQKGYEFFPERKKIVDNFDDVKRAHLAQSVLFNKVKDNFEVNENGEITIKEVNEDEKKGKNSADFAETSEKTIFDLMDREVQALISTLTDKDVNGKEILDPIFGLPKLVDFPKYTGLISQSFQDTQSITEILSGIKETAKKYPALNDLIKKLTINESPQVKQLRVKFVKSLGLVNREIVLGLVRNNDTLTEVNGLQFIERKAPTIVVQKAVSSKASQIKNDITTYFYQYPASESRFITNVNGENVILPEKIEEIKKYPYALSLSDRINFFRELGLNIDNIVSLMTDEEKNEMFSKQNVSMMIEHLTKYLQQKGAINDIIKAFNTDLEGKTKEDKVLRNIVNYQMKYNNFYITSSKLNAEGKLENEKTLWSSIDKNVIALTKAKSLKELVKNGNYEFLNGFLSNDLYTDLKSSKLLKYLYDEKGIRTKAKLEIKNYNGLESIDEEENGLKTKNLYPLDKALMDIAFFLNDNRLTTMQLSNKATYLSFKFDEPLVKDDADFEATMYQYLLDELNLIKRYDEGDKNLTKLQKLSANIKDKDGNYQFGIFRSIIKGTEKNPDMPQKIIKEFLKTGDLRPEVKAYVLSTIRSFFNKELSDTIDFMGDSFNDIASTSKTYERLPKEFLLKAYIQNQFVFNVESYKLFFGNIYMHKDPYKRIAGATSAGVSILSDPQILKDFNSVTNVTQRSKMLSHFEEVLGFAPNFANVRTSDDEVRFITFKDREKPSTVVLDNILTAIDQKRKSGKLSSAELADLEQREIAIKKAYGNVNASDAMGAITIDAWRKNLWCSGRWNDQLQEVYEKMVNWDYHNKRYKYYNGKGDFENANIELTERQKYEISPEEAVGVAVLKYQLYGNVKNGSIAEKAFHKFQLMPLIPQLIDGKNWEKHVERMVLEDVDYAVFDSGDKLENDETREDFYNQSGSVSTLESLKPDYEKNQNSYNIKTTYLENLKEQVYMENGVDNSLLFGSQVRKLIFLSDDFSDLYDEFRDIIGSLTEYEKNNLFERSGLNSNGEVEDKTKFIDFLLGEVDKKVVNRNVKDYLRLTNTGELAYSLDTNIQRQPIESIINSVINNRLVKQKMYGESMVQVSNVGFENFGSTKSLKFYGIEKVLIEKVLETTVRKMEVKVPLSGKFLNLLNLTHSDGKPIETRERLNEEIRNGKIDARSLTMIGYRIPTQEHNSIEVMTVEEFLDPISNLIVVPYELTAKAGSDFDIDKLNIFKPHIDINGNYIEKKFDSRKEAIDNYIETKNRVNPQIIETRVEKFNWQSDLVKETDRVRGEIFGKIKTLKSDLSFYKGQLKDNIIFNAIVYEKNQIIQQMYELFDDYMGLKSTKKDVGGKYNYERGEADYKYRDTLKFTVNKEVRDYLDKTNSPFIKALFDEYTDISDETPIYDVKNEIVKKYNDRLSALLKIAIDLDAQYIDNTPLKNRIQELAGTKGYDSTGTFVGQTGEIQSLYAKLDSVFTNPKSAKIIIKGEIPEELRDIYEKNMGVQIELTEKLNQLYAEKNEAFQGMINFKNSYQNRIIEISDKVLLNPDNFINLVTPNSTFMFDDAIDNVFKARYDESEYTYKKGKIAPNDINLTNSLIPRNNWLTYKILNDAGNALGIAAVGNVFFQLVAKAGVNFTQDYMDKFNLLFEMGKLSDRNLLNGQSKATGYSQLINLEVDIANDPRAGYVNLGEKAVPIFNTMINLGIPVNQALYFLNQPMIVDYIDFITAKDKTIIHTEMGEERFDDPFNAFLKKKKYDLGVIYNQQGYEIDYSRFFLTDKKTIQDVFKQLIDEDVETTVTPEALLTLLNTKTKDLTEDQQARFNRKQLLLLTQLVQYQTIADSYRELQSSMNFDTTISRDGFDAFKRESLFNEIVSKDIFTNLDKLKEETIIAPLNISKEMINLNKTLLPLVNTETMYDYINTKLETNYKKRTSSDKNKFVRTFKNDFISYLFQNFLTRSETGMERFNTTFAPVLKTAEEDFTGKPNEFGFYLLKNLFKDLVSLKQKYPAEFEKYSLLERLFIQSEEDFRNIGLSYFNKDSQLQDSFINQFTELLNSPNLEIRNFMLKFAYMSFYQSGLNKSFISSADVIPVPVFGKILEDVRQQYMKDVNSEAKEYAILEDFNDRFLANNNSFRTKRQNKSTNNRLKVKSYRGKDLRSDYKIDDILESATKPTVETKPIVGLPGPETKINIYASTGENAELSNFAIRPFTFNVQQNNNADYMGKKSFQSVEQAFQWHKVQYADTIGMGARNRNEIAQDILNTTDGAKLRKLGKDFYLTKFKSKWDRASSTIMKNLLKSSFEQNPEALKKLLATGNATLTHMYNGVEQDKGRFSKLLMEVREELKPKLEAKPTTTTEEYIEFGTDYRFTLEDGKVIKGEFKQAGKDWEPMNAKKVASKYESLSTKLAEETVEEGKGLTVTTPSIFDARKVQIDYTAGQTKALAEIEDLIKAKKQGYYLLAGYAGTGKTTIAENIAKFAKQNGKTPVVLAPTNKAAKVLNDKLKSTGVDTEATTIHKAIYGEPDPITGEWVPGAKIKNSVLIIDESSMISKEIMKDLIDNTQNNNILIFMGDSFQLEPVGEDSGLFKGKVAEVGNNKTELTEVKRQSLDSNVLKVATITREDGKPYVPSTSIEDFKVSKSRTEFIEDFKSAIRNNEDAVAIVATNAERISMNKIARQEKFGSDKNVLNEREVMISVANSSKYPNSEIFEMGRIDSSEEMDIEIETKDGKTSKYKAYFVNGFTKDGKSLTMLHVPLLDKPSLYHAQLLDFARKNSNFMDALDGAGLLISTKRGLKLSPTLVIATYGYSVTAHKSQGSQWEKVFVNQNYVAPSWNGARWYYTAITRSSKDVIVLNTGNNIGISEEEMNKKLTILEAKSSEEQETEQPGCAAPF